MFYVLFAELYIILCIILLAIGWVTYHTILGNIEMYNLFE